mgnify:CR=1 FL=1
MIFKKLFSVWRQERAGIDVKEARASVKGGATTLGGARGAKRQASIELPGRR